MGRGVTIYNQEAALKPTFHLDIDGCHWGGGGGFTSRGQESGSVFSTAVCKIQASKRYVESIPLPLPSHLPSCLPDVMHMTLSPRPSPSIFANPSDQKLEAGTAWERDSLLHRLTLVHTHSYTCTAVPPPGGAYPDPRDDMAAGLVARMPQLAQNLPQTEVQSLPPSLTLSLPSFLCTSTFCSLLFPLSFLFPSSFLPSFFLPSSFFPPFFILLSFPDFRHLPFLLSSTSLLLCFSLLSPGAMDAPP